MHIEQRLLQVAIYKPAGLMLRCCTADTQLIKEDAAYQAQQTGGWPFGKFGSMKKLVCLFKCSLFGIVKYRRVTTLYGQNDG